MFAYRLQLKHLQESLMCLPNAVFQAHCQEDAIIDNTYNLLPILTLRSISHLKILLISFHNRMFQRHVNFTFEKYSFFINYKQYRLVGYYIK